MAVIITDIIGAIIILVGIQQMAKGKLNKNNAITVCLSITIIPILLLLIFYVFTAVLIRGTAPFSFDYLSLAILNVELIMVVFYLLSKCFSLPYSRLSQDADASKNAVSIDRVIKMLYCFIYLSIILLLIISPVIVPFIKIIFAIGNAGISITKSILTSGKIIESLIGTIIGIILVCMFIMPLLGVQGLIVAYLFIIIATILVILIIFHYIFIINATIRFVMISRNIRKYAVLYCFLMLIPIVNIVSAIILIIKARKELKNEGYSVGLFGVKVKRGI